MCPVATPDIDALLVVSFGGPEKPGDVIAFLENVTAGRGVPRARLEEVAGHYQAFGGVSPINEQNRNLIEAVRGDLARNDLDLPVYWGNRNWHPFLHDVMRQMAADGVQRAAYFVTSAYSSYSGCRQYRENLYEAALDTGVELARLRQYFNHPGFVTPFAEATEVALAVRPDAHVVFVTHSIPLTMDGGSGGPEQHAYLRQHQEVARLVADQAGAERWTLAFCSRSGAPHQPWLEPDINAHLRELAAEGVASVVVVPIGFVCDHMEVVFDLDTEAAQTAAELGLDFVRVSTPGTHPAFVSMIRELLLERVALDQGAEPVRSALGGLPPNPDLCPDDCCENLRVRMPAIP